MDADLSDASTTDGEQVDAALPGPLVRIEAPAAASSPSSDNVLTESSLEIICVAEDNPDGDDVRGDSVFVEVAAVASSAPALTPIVTALGGDRYRALANLNELPAGELEITCGAAGVNGADNIRTASLTTLYDTGPSIAILEPTSGDTFARLQTTTARVEVSEQPLAEGDADAVVSAVRFVLNGVTVPAAQISKIGSEYRYEIAFDDPDYFQADTQTTRLVIEAENGRGALRSESVTVNVDPFGPTIAFQGEVTDQRILGGEKTVSVRVQDTGGAGVDPAQVTVKLGTREPVAMTLVGDVFTHTFSTLLFGRTTPQVNIEVVAYDLVGNRSSNDVQIFLDTYGPWISLDPPTWRVADETQTLCSPAFDPVGNSDGPDVPMPNDLDTRPDNVVLRALVYEQTNSAPGVTSVRYSGVNTDTVRAYIQRDLTTPLLIDDDPSDGQNHCTAVYRDVQAGDSMPESRELRALAPSNFGTNIPYSSSYVEAPDDPTGLVCSATPSDREAESRCGQTPRFVVRHGQITAPTPIVYAMNPAASIATVNCRGADIPIGAQQSGWVCIVVRAEDEAGNVSFSPPHRVCIDKDWTGAGHPSPCAGIPPPSCTDGCTTADPRDPPSQVSRWVIER